VKSQSSSSALQGTRNPKRRYDTRESRSGQGGPSGKFSINGKTLDVQSVHVIAG
jgi:hypothetical protein